MLFELEGTATLSIVLSSLSWPLFQSVLQIVSKQLMSFNISETDLSPSDAFGASAERLSGIIRARVFQAVLRQDIAFFDKDENSTGKLVRSTRPCVLPILIFAAADVIHLRLGTES